MDGVLVDAREWHYEALNRALGIFGFQISHEDHLASYDGLPTSAKLDMLSSDHGLPVALHGFINQLKQQYTVEIIHAKCRPIFALEYALSRLRQSGYKIAVASNSIASTVDLMMEKSGLAEYLDLQVAATDVSTPKPDPEIYLVAAEKLGVSPDQCLVIEDSQFGIASARAAGTQLMMVNGVDDVNFQSVWSRLEELTGTGKS